MGLLLRTGGEHVLDPSLRRSHSSMEVHHRHQSTFSSLSLLFILQAREFVSLFAGRKKNKTSAPKGTAAIVFLRHFDNLSR